MNNVPRLILVIALMLAIAALFFIPKPVGEPPVPVLQIGQVNLGVELADTPQLRRQGLSGRAFLAADTGMLFLFDAPDRHRFWMRDMRFDLDFIWIVNGKVAEITPNVLAEPGVADENLRVYLPQVPVDSMLEVNRGWAAQNGIQVGDSVQLLLP